MFLFGFASTTLTKDYTPNCLAAHVDRLADVPYAGQYTGPYTVKASVFGNQSGKFTLSIGEDGKVTGKAENYTVGKTADISGSVNENGDINLIAEWSDSTYTIKGTAIKTKGGHLQGTLTQYAGKKVVCTIEIDLLPFSEIDPVAAASEIDPVVAAQPIHDPVDPVAVAQQIGQSKTADAIGAEGDVAAQNAASLRQTNPTVDQAFCSIASAVGKGCGDTLNREELWKGWIAYLKNAGYSVKDRSNNDVVAFGSIEQLHAKLGNGVGHIEVILRQNIYAPQTPTPTSRVLGAGSVTIDPSIGGVRRTTPADVTPPVTVRWWVFYDPNSPGHVKKIVADNIDMPYYPLDGYAAELALAIDPDKEGTNRSKFATYFNNRTYRK